MSTITNIILTTGLGERAAVESLNRSYGHEIGVPLCRVFDDSLSRDNVLGGNKELECSVYVSSMSNLNVIRLRQLIETVFWNSPEEVQLFLKRQDDDIFEEVKLKLAQEEVLNKKLNAITLENQ